MPEPQGFRGLDRIAHDIADLPTQLYELEKVAEVAASIVLSDVSTDVSVIPCIDERLSVAAQAKMKRGYPAREVGPAK